MPTLQKHLPTSQSFTRLRSLADVEADIAEARRVGYITHVVKDTDDYGNEYDHAFTFSIYDDETGDIVMEGIGPVNGTHYAVRLSKLYWQEPALA